MPEVLNILQELESDHRRVNAATTELFKVSRDLHGGIDEQGELVRGVAAEYQDAMDNELIALEERYLFDERRLPAADIRASRVVQAVRTKHPELVDRFRALSAQEQSLKQTISGRKAAISAAQSILRGER